MTKCFMLSRRSSVAMLGLHRLPVSRILQKRHYESHRSCKPGYLYATAYPGSLSAYYLLRMTVEPPYRDSDNPHTEPRLASEGVVSTAYSWITCGIAMPGRCRLSWSAPQKIQESRNTHPKTINALMFILSYAVRFHQMLSVVLVSQNMKRTRISSM